MGDTVIVISHTYAFPAVTSQNGLQANNVGLLTKIRCLDMAFLLNNKFLFTLSY